MIREQELQRVEAALHRAKQRASDPNYCSPERELPRHLRPRQTLRAQWRRKWFGEVDNCLTLSDPSSTLDHRSPESPGSSWWKYSNQMGSARQGDANLARDLETLQKNPPLLFEGHRQQSQKRWRFFCRVLLLFGLWGTGHKKDLGCCKTTTSIKLYNGSFVKTNHLSRCH